MGVCVRGAWSHCPAAVICHLSVTACRSVSRTEVSLNSTSVPRHHCRRRRCWLRAALLSWNGHCATGRPPRPRAFRPPAATQPPSRASGTDESESGPPGHPVNLALVFNFTRTLGCRLRHRRCAPRRGYRAAGLWGGGGRREPHNAAPLWAGAAAAARGGVRHAAGAAREPPACRAVP